MPRKKDAAPDFLAVDVEPQITEISQSYFRKLNMSAHGGAQYETLDLGVVLKATIQLQQDVTATSKALYEKAKQIIEDEIQCFDEAMLKENTPEKKQKSELGIDKAELEGIFELINKLIAADTKEKMAELGEEIKERQDLNPNQLNYLRMKFSAKLKLLK